MFICSLAHLLLFLMYITLNFCMCTCVYVLFLHCFYLLCKMFEDYLLSNHKEDLVKILKDVETEKHFSITIK